MLPLHQTGYVALIQNYDIWTPKLTVSCSASELNQRVVEIAGFEPTASWSQTKRDNRITLYLEIKIMLGYPSRPNLNCLIVVLRALGRGCCFQIPHWIVDIR